MEDESESCPSLRQNRSGGVLLLQHILSSERPWLSCLLAPPSQFCYISSDGRKVSHSRSLAVHPGGCKPSHIGQGQVTPARGRRCDKMKSSLSSRSLVRSHFFESLKGPDPTERSVETGGQVGKTVPPFRRPSGASLFYYCCPVVTHKGTRSSRICYV